MTRRTWWTVGAVSLALATGALSAPLAQASTSGGETMGDFTVTMTTANGVASEAELSCYPNGGPHANVTAACADLSAADGDVAQIPPESGSCVKMYAPVVAEVVGTWRGQPRSFGAEFDNACVANLETGGAVFTFE